MPILFISSVVLDRLVSEREYSTCSGEKPILQLALHDDSIWVASTDSSVTKWPAEGHNPQKVVVQKSSSFLGGNLSFSRVSVTPYSLRAVTCEFKK